MLGTVLLVDDEPLIREYLTFLLLDHGFRSVACVDGPSALRHLSVAGDEIALVFSDIGMGGMNGIEFLAQVRTFAPDLPFVLLSGSCDEPLAVNAYRAGASDYLLKPVAEKDFIDLVKKHSYCREARDIGPAKDVPARLLQLFRSLEKRRFETMQHSQRVAAYCRLIAINFGLRGGQLAELEVGALLHDIGKVAVPQNVIEKPGRLTEDEWRVMKLHPAIGASLLSEIPDCAAESDIVLCHHERFDGAGYPNGLRGGEIPLGARIFAVADTLDAICSMRPYRKASPLGVAKAEIEVMAGSQFDPAVVQSFQLITDSEILAVQKIYGEEHSPVTFRHPSNNLPQPFPAFHPSR